MKPVRWGIIGIGKHFVQRTLLPMQQAELVELYAAASRDADKAQRTAAAFGIPKSYGSYDDLLADPTIEAVFMPIPNNVHLEWIKKAADAGKHIVCEKPLTMDAAEARAAFNYTGDRGVLLMEAFMYRFHRQWKHVRNIIRTGGLGAVRAVQCHFSYSNLDPKNIRNRVETGGGGIYDLGCYGISSARLVFGAEPSRVISLIRRDPDFKTDMLTSAIMDFGAGHAVFTVSTQSFPHQSVEIFGTSGRIVVEVPFNPFDDAVVALAITDRQGTRRVEFAPENQYQLQFDAFSRAIREDADSPIPPEDSIANMAVIDAVFRSEKSGSWETPA